MRSTDQDEPGQNSGARWLWLIVALVIGFFKARAWADFLHHRDVVLAVLGAAVLGSILRARPVTFAAAVATLFAVLMRPRTLGLGVVDGVIGFTALIGLLLGLVVVVELRARLAERRARDGTGPAALRPPRP